MNNTDHIPYIPYGRQTVSEQDTYAVMQVLKSPYLTQGPVVSRFEEAIARRVSAKHSVSANSATSALHLACLALGLGPGDHLWTSPITFVASANCGRYCQASVDFVDIEPRTGLMSVAALERKLEQAAKDGRLPKIVVPVHLGGSSCDMKAIGGLARRYGFAVIEDASHAIGGAYQAEPVGSCRYSDITVFSFHPVKIITTAEGGLATTNDPKLAQAMSELRSHGIVRDANRFTQRANGPWSYEQQNLGYNYRMSDIQAALGLSQLERLDSLVHARNIQRLDYIELLRSLPLYVLDIPDNVSSSVHLTVARLTETTPNGHRKIFEGLRNKGIGVQLHYSPVHLQPYYRDLGFCLGQFREAESYASSAISLPTFPGLTEEMQMRVVEVLAEEIKMHSPE